MRLRSEVLTILWFDTEDFITPESDDSAFQIAKLLEKHGIKATFKLVGEKVRALQQRNRGDVIDALSHFDIGYHTDKHSIHPIMSEYVDGLDWDRGVSEFERRERPGYDEIRRVFGSTPSCFGHPGMSWVPQAYPVLTKWDIQVYLDETYTITPLDERPFYYANMLNVMCLGSNVLSLDASGGPKDLPDDSLIKAKGEFLKIYDKLSHQGKTGVISIPCHPTTFATEQFWDKVNFSNGRNPKNGVYKKPQLKTSEHIKRDLDNLEKFLVLGKSLPNNHFIDARDALSLYPDKANGRDFSISELRHLSKKSLRSINYYDLDGVWISPAEIFSMVLQALSEFQKSGVLPDSVTCVIHPLGPKEIVETNLKERTIDPQKFWKICTGALEKTRGTGYIPSSFKVSGGSISPADMFATCCSILTAVSAGKRPSKVQVRKGIFSIGRAVTDEGGRRDWNYYYHKKGFKAPKQTELARLQTWTLKPAVPDEAALQRITKA